VVVRKQWKCGGGESSVGGQEGKQWQYSGGGGGKTKVMWCWWWWYMASLFTKLC